MLTASVEGMSAGGQQHFFQPHINCIGLEIDAPVHDVLLKLDISSTI
jgi:hypothetical protein